nr:sulfite exporter TauE/SafE family protein [Streptomyces malaysiensis]
MRDRDSKCRRREIHWRPVLAYSLTGVPGAALGAQTLLTIPPVIADALLAVFFIVMIPSRRLCLRSRVRVRLWYMAIAGAIVGFLTRLMLSTGPLSVPVFTGYLLSGRAFLGSEAASAVLLYAGKLATFTTPSSLCLRCSRARCLANGSSGASEPARSNFSSTVCSSLVRPGCWLPCGERILHTPKPRPHGLPRRCKDLGISWETLRNWVRPSRPTETVALRAEPKAMRKENEKLAVERDILILYVGGG